MLIWGLTFNIGLAGFGHSGSTTGEVLSTVVNGRVGTGHSMRWHCAEAPPDDLPERR